MNPKVRNAVKLALAVNAGLIGLALAPGSFAQEEGADVEEITVTGSRIKKKDFVSNAPVATVGAEQIVLTGTVNTESLLNTLPQTVPGLDRTSNNPGGGFATVNLRGLGSNRTLVLINGTRVIPSTSGGTVDINSIPNALIEDIEVLTGGASAVYGSDAVAGVVNFILKDDFEGVALNAGFETTQEGDADIWSTDLTLGANLYDGRGNVTINFAFTDRAALFQGDRDFAFFAQFDDTDANGNPILVDGGSSGIPGTSIFSGAFGTFAPDSFGITFNQDGSHRPFDSTSPTGNDFYNYAPVNYIQLPQKRYQTTALGHFEINDRTEVYGRAFFTQSKVPQQLAATPIFQTSTATLDGNPFLPVATQQFLSDTLGDGVDTDGDGIDDTVTAFFRRRLIEVGPRIVNNTFSSYQIMGGIRGSITDTWDYDGYVQQGNVSYFGGQLGNVNRDRFNQALLVDVAADPTGNTCVDGSTNGSTVGCSPMNIFGEGNISEDAAAFLRTAVSFTADLDQTIIGANFTGDLGETISLPGGAIGAAFGWEHIENKFDFSPSQDLAAGTIAGFNGSPPVRGSFDVDSLYAEFYLPIVSGAPFADLLDLELAYRISDYTSVGNVESYKIAGSWAPVDSFRIRGGFNTAVRAPNIGELFAPLGENFPGSLDPCAAEGNPTAAQVPICEATGVPVGLTGSPALDLAAGQVRELFGGNPLLKEEEADTYTVGFVWTPNFVDGLSLSVDYFDIEITDYVAQFGGGANNVLVICYDADSPFGGIGSDFCNAVERRVDGTIEFVEAPLANVAEQTLKGYDIVGSYDTELWGGDLRINYVATFTTESDFEAFPGADLIVCDGRFGNNCGEPLPDYSHRMTFNWARENYLVQLSWRQVGESTDDDDAKDFTIEKIKSEAYFDAAGSYNFNDNWGVTFGIDNLLDTDPPILGDNQEQANTWPATYDVFGRTFFVKASMQY
jgi:outer membrane receptor protein involved in Fe transport